MTAVTFTYFGNDSNQMIEKEIKEGVVDKLE